jgi:hypothetical protein
VVAVKVTSVELLMVKALIVNVVEVRPWGTVTVVGTLAAAVLELASDTTTPPVPADDVRVTVPIPDWPLARVLGLTEIPLRAGGGGSMVTPKVTLAPEYEAVKVAAVGELTLPAVIMNEAELEPDGMVTVEGTLAAVAMELESDTETPLVPAAEVRLTVPVPVCPLAMVLGLTEILLRAGGAGLTVMPKVVFTPE